MAGPRYTARSRRWFASMTDTQSDKDFIERLCNVFITRFSEPKQVSLQKPRGGTAEKKLKDVTVAIKDIFCTKGTVTSCASRMLHDFKPTYDAAIVSRLQEHGAVIVGKTNMDEFSMGSASVFSHFGRVLNPHGYCPDRRTMIHRHSAGGSSGGSAAAAAASLCDVAIGSDTGGSIRLPAAYCGVIGLKPSYGLISRHGMIQYSTSLDTVGIVSRSISLLQRTYSSLEGYDQRDPTSILPVTRLKSQHFNRQWQSECDTSPMEFSNLRVGVPIEYFTSDLSEEVLRAFRTVVDFLKSKGAEFVSVSLPSTPNCLGAYYVIASAEASSNLARYSGAHYGHRSILDSPVQGEDTGPPGGLYEATRTEGLGSEVKRRLLLGAYSLSASGMANYFIQAQKIRLQVREEFDRVFRPPNPLSDTGKSFSSKGVDILLTPPTLGPAPCLDQEGLKNSPIIANWNQDKLLVPASLAGLPAMVIPVEQDSSKSWKWPVGVQIIGQWGTEPMLFQVGAALERIGKLPDS